jgi:BlaI family transcriptional regulator, penicillinase repressor
MTQPIHTQFGRRERQIMDVIYRLGRASVTEVRDNLTDPPTYSAVRAMLGFLEDKGYLRHEREGMKYVYLPTVDAKQARRSALQHMVKTFFNGSAAQAAAALIEMNDTQLSNEEIKRLSELIKKARQEGR